MADYNIDINVNMGGQGSSSMQSLIDSMNNLSASYQKIGTAGKEAGDKAKNSFADSMRVMSEYGNNVKKVESEISKLKKQIIEQNEALRKGKVSQDQHKASVDQLHASLKQLQGAQRQYNSLLGQSASHAKNATTAFGQLTNVFNKFGAVLGVSFGLYGVIRVLVEAVKTIKDFDLAQKKLQSILGETADGMKEISQSAIELGKSSIFGAKGVSELQIELAKMGFTKNEIMAMQGAINDLAIATQEDLASSAEVVANIIKVYGMTATETRDVVNVMGKAFNDSALGLSNFREAIKYVAPVAKQAGFSFRETVAALELLANAGLKGSLTGTGLNNVLKAMMDSNSKLAKNLGGTVQGWDGFISVLQRAQKEGWNMQDIFGLITQRATGAFSVLLEGVDILEASKKSLQDVTDIMREQASVQLDSIAYQAKLVKENWKAMILEMDNGNGTLSKTAKFFLAGLSGSMFMVARSMGGYSKQIVDQLIDVKEALRLDGVEGKLKEDLDNISKDLESAGTRTSKQTKLQTLDDLNFITNTQKKASELISYAITDAAQKRIESLKIEGKTYEEFETARLNALIILGYEQATLLKERKKNTLEYKVLEESLAKIEMMRYQSTSTAIKEDTELEKERLKALKESYAYELEMLKLRKELEDEQIKNRLDNYEEQFALQANLYAYEVERANKELEMAIALGEDEVKAKNKYNLILEIAAIEHANKMIAIREKMNEDLAKAEKRLLGDAMKPRDEVSSDYTKDWESRMKKLDDFMADFKFKNPLLAKLFGQQIEEGLFSGLITEDDATRLGEAFKTVFDSIGDSLTGYVDAWTEATDRVVEQLNRQIDETQSALDTEVELMTNGYANNVTLKRKELEDLKKLRADALKDQKQAQKAQATIDTITQLTSLITAASQIMKGFSAIPFVGVGLGIAAVSAMFSAFAIAKVKAFQLANTPKYEKGGRIGGRRHSQGGTLIEAEVDEFMINRKSAIKHKALVEAINRDDTYEINRIYLNQLKGGIMRHNVSLDESKELKAIRQLLEPSNKQVEYHNGYRIEKVGNVRTKILMN